ncbi:MAG TPA: AAA family ATPase [Nocardioidaceae bacterium]|nr:AAA family ATPase [Nocardioidaceae bacterium]
MLVGREPEQRRVEQLIAAARIGHSGVLLVTGEPGIGKTALLEDAAARADGMRVLRASGAEAEADIAFGGLLQLLRPALGLLDQIPVPQSDALAAALALRPGSPGDRFAVGAATLSLLCRFAEEHPLAVLVDDLPRLDRPSAEALAFAARRLMADPVVFLATARTAEVDDLAAELPQLQLTGVELASAELLVASGAAGALAPELVTRLYQATAGNPLGLLELARDLPALEDRSPEAPLPLPATLAQAFSGRVRRLGGGARTVLLVAAAAGSDLRVLRRACEIMGVDVSRLAEAEATGLVRILDDRVDFRHPLMRSAAYDDAAPAQRRAVHRAVAEALPASDVDRRAWQLAESALGPDESIAALLTQTAERAVGRSAHAVAATAYERAARLSPDDHARLTRLTAAAESAWLSGSGDRAIRLLDAADGLRPSAAERTRLLRLRGSVAARTGSLVESRDILTAAAEAAGTEESIVLLADAVNACQYLGDAGSALRIAGRIEAALPDAETVRARAVGTLAAGMGRIFAATGGAAQVRTGVDLLASSADLADDERQLGWLILGMLWLRDSDNGEGLRRLVGGVRAQASVGWLPFLLFHLARDDATTRSWARAEATYSEGIRLARETGQTTELATCLAGLAWLQARQGRSTGCREGVDEAMRICVDRHIHLGRAWLLFALGELELGVGDPAAALEHLSQLDDFLAELGLGDPDLSPAPEVTEVLMRLGRREHALRVAEGYQERATAKGQPWALARAARSLGMCGPDADLDRHFQAALALHERTLDAYETARTQLAYGARLRRARRRLDARAPLRAALETFGELGAAPWADHAGAELEATGERVRRRTRAAADALTPQELQIAVQLAEGRTTREAAAALFLSPKTVEYHLRKVYTKLGIRSRAELAQSLPP